MAKKNLVVVFVLLLIATVAQGVSPSAPFLAINSQGRPLVGGTVSVTDENGAPVTVYSNIAGTVEYSGIVPSTGIVQFFGATDTYIVTVSAQGTTRTYYVDIPSTADALTDADFPAYGGWMRKVSAGSYTSVKVNLAAVTNPTTGDDSGDDYSIGSIWVNVLTDDIYFCTDATLGGAIWRTIGAAITSINSQTGAAITLGTGSTGSDLNISNPIADTLNINIPSMTGAAVTRGLLTNTTQTIPGVKTFTNLAFFSNNIQVNTALASTSSTFNTSGYFGALNIDGTNNQVTFFDTAAAASGISTRMYAASDTTDTVLTLSSDLGGHGISATSVGAAGGGSAGMFTAGLLSTGNGIESDSLSANARAAVFLRSVNGSNVPIVGIRRNTTTDAQDMLKIEDLGASTSAPYAVTYYKNGTLMNALRTDGEVVATTPDETTPLFGSATDIDSGFGTNGGVPNIIDESTEICTFSASAIACTGSTSIGLVRTGGASFALGLTAVVTGDTEITGEIKVSGVTGSGKAICVKSDSNFGVCSDAPDGSGVCTCG